MATAQVLISTQSSKPSSQNTNLPGSRKRKPSMPATHLSSTPVSGSRSHHVSGSQSHRVSGSQSHRVSGSQSHQPESKDKRVLIKAIASVHNYPEEFVFKCARYLAERGEVVNNETLTDECEAKWPHETSSATDCLEEPVSNSFSGAGTSSASSSSSSYPSSAYSLPGSSHSSEFLSLPVSNHSSQESPSRHHSLISYAGSVGDSLNGAGHADSNTASNMSSNTSNWSTQSRMHDDIEEDCVDGMIPNLPPMQFNDDLGSMRSSSFAAGSSAAVSGSHEEFNAVSSLSPSQDATSSRSSGSVVSGYNDMPTAASLATSQPAAEVQESHASASKPSGTSRLQNSWPRIPDSLSKPTLSPVSRSSADLKNIIWNELDMNTLVKIDNSENLDIEETEQQAVDDLESKFEVHFLSAEHVNTCLKLVKKEHSLLEKSRLCTSCCARPRDVTFLPCGHFATCRDCAEPIYVCPICSKSILATVNTFLS